MKYGEYLKNNLTTEWKSKYINYDQMKRMIARTVTDIKMFKLDQIAYVDQFEMEFFMLCREDLYTINEFYKKKVIEGKNIYENLCKNFEEKTINLTEKNNIFHIYRGYFSELYLSLTLLSQYQELNYIGFQKILKKYDKNFPGQKGLYWFEENIKTSYFHTNNEIEILMTDLENYFTESLMYGNRKKAIERLHIPPLRQLTNITFLVFRFGLFFGGFLILLITVLISITYYNFDAIWTCDLVLFRGPLLIILLLFLCGVNIYIWRAYGINHILIFGNDPRQNINEYHIMELTSIFGIMWSVCVLSFVHQDELRMSKYLPICIVYLVLIAFLFNPLNIWYYNTRKWTRRYLWRVLTAPYYDVTFADFWIADLLTSLAVSFVDFFRFILQFGSDDTNRAYCTEIESTGYFLIYLIPYWFRIAQTMKRYYDTKNTFPHIPNSGKFMSIAVSAAMIHFYVSKKEHYSDRKKNPWYYMMIITSIISSAYSFIWDIKIDWGLLSCKSLYICKHKLLRDEIIYKQPIFYYFAAIFDLILRFRWFILIESITSNSVHNELVITLIAVGELFRRFVWNIFHLENEHLNNCGQFRAVREIPISERNTELIESRTQLESSIGINLFDNENKEVE